MAALQTILRSLHSSVPHELLNIPHCDASHCPYSMVYIHIQSFQLCHLQFWCTLSPENCQILSHFLFSFFIHQKGSRRSKRSGHTQQFPRFSNSKIRIKLCIQSFVAVNSFFQRIVLNSNVSGILLDKMSTYNIFFKLLPEPYIANWYTRSSITIS